MSFSARNRNHGVLDGIAVLEIQCLSDSKLQR